MSTAINAGSFKSVILKNSLTPEQGIDVTDLVTELQIFQSIQVPFLTGKILMVDGVSLLDNIMILGTEVFDVTIETRSSNGEMMKTSLTLIGTGVEKLHKDGNTNIYAISVGSKHMIENLHVRLCQAYKGSSSDIVKEILVDKLGIAEEDIDLEKTTDNVKLIVPNLKLADSLMWIARRATSESKTPCFIYEYVDNSMAFKSLAKMYSVRPIITYYRNDTTQSDPTGTYTSIIDVQFDSVGKGYKNINEGMFAAKVYAFDMTTKQVMEENFSLSDYETNANLLNDALPDPALRISGKTLYELYDAKVYNLFTSTDGSDSAEPKKTGTDDYTGDYHTNSQFKVPYLNSKLQQLENFAMTITVHGNLNVFPGAILNIEFPSSTRLVKGGDKRNDFYYSGKYLTMSIKHVFTAQNYMTHAQIAKDSLLVSKG